MSATTWFIIAIVGFSLSGITLTAAILMFIKMNIPAIIGDLSGKTVAREIKAMRDANISSGDKRFQSSKVNLERGTLTEKVAKPAIDAEIVKKVHASQRLDKKTEQLSDNLSKEKRKTAGIGEKNSGGSPSTELLSGASPSTEFLSGGFPLTELLNGGSPPTEFLNGGSPPTEFLSGGSPPAASLSSGGTTVLSQTEELNEVEGKPVAFKVVRSELLVHSDEVIS